MGRVPTRPDQRARCMTVDAGAAVAANRGAPGLGAPRPLTPAPQPDPKEKAIQFALELAKIRATAGTANERMTDVDKLTSDATRIAEFLKSGSGVGSRP